MKDVSIEYAHIYTNSRISEEHELSLKELDAIREQSESLVVMVDDYSFPDPTFDYGTFTAWLSEKGHTPNVVMRESQLIPLCDDTLRLMPDGKLKTEMIEYIKAKKYPCSLFIASWYLLRLGKLTHSDFPKEEYAERLINILPESFKPFEDKAIDIITSTEHRDVVSSIRNVYLPGRLIA
jgi:hypothetical protein